MSSSDDAERKKRIAIIVVSSFLLVAVVVAVTVGVSIQEEESDYDDRTTDGNKHAQVTSSKKAIKMICQPTTFKRTCEEQLQQEAGNKTDVKDLIQAAFKAAIKYVEQAQANSTLLRDLEKDEGTRSALDACKILLNSTMSEFNKSLELVDKIEVNTVNKLLGDMKIWLSATISNQQACLDGFEKTKSKTEAGEKMKKFLNITMQLSRNGLAIACELSEQLQQLELAGMFERRRLLQDEDGLPVIGHSDWTSF
ncbi:putative pectinesterase/pectinesterase inhibitor 28 [Gossypium hirsutum]|nr:putative pectinesterase/pectinesterase inhibitor 28 [Gossypium hirsutum]